MDRTTGPVQARAFSTKVDVWLVLSLLVALGVMANGIVERFGVVTGLGGTVGALFAPLVACALIALVALPTRYELGATELVVRSGVLRYRVPYPDIKSVVPSRNPLAGPAWSIDRLKVTRPYGYLLISPKDKQGFLSALHARTPHLDLVDDRLLPRDEGHEPSVA